MTAERKRNGKLRLIVWYGSERLSGKRERIKVRRDLRAGVEPAKQYRTGRLWVD